MLRSLAWRVAPGVMSDRAHRFSSRWRDEQGIARQAADFVARHGDRVLAGPFAGMRCLPTGDAVVAKLAGTYEQEIAGWMSAALERRPARFVDIGAAEGYYAVGVARRGVPVVAYEASRLARRQLRTMARLNDVSLDVRGLATVRRLLRLDLGGAVVLSDCEGAELSLFSPRLVRRLATATVIVELHEALAPSVTDVLRDRFQATHRVELTDVLPRRDTPVAPAAGLSENRSPHTQWALFAPR